MEITCSFETNATVVANEFIDRCMAAANGEYVKVYLYILRHQKERLDVSRIADALNHTESDVRRALTYWEKQGVLKTGTSGQERAGDFPQESGTPERIFPESEKNREKQAVYGERNGAAETASSRPAYSQEQVNRLTDDEEFTQLLYIAQKYMKKAFTPRECEVFAYLYDGLHMTAELLEYLVEYCVQGGHMSIRYIETVALNWHEKGLKTVEEAKEYASCFTKDSFAVMRAFGLGDRKPGDAERELIRRWFSVYGFTKELVLEACNRTLEATHAPSFRYADKILSEWKKAQVRNLEDVAALDQKRQNRQYAAKNGVKKANQFHNFEQRSTNYDSMVMDQVKSWIGES